MGSSTSTGLEAAKQRSASRIGQVAVSGRYHKATQRKLEDDFEIQPQILGSGYNGQVHLAKRKNSPSNDNYAVKGFKLHGVKRDKREELETECEIFLSLDHPHVVRLLDVYESADKLDLVMECMDGGELFKRVILKKRFSERDAADATSQMLLAVNYLHENRVVHRDIKLENFLYENKNYDHLKLIDFGFSKMWAPNEKMALSCGTLSYVAPEVLGRSYTSQCDMWSLGVVVFILLSGYMPFSGTQDKQLAAIKHGKYSYRKEYWAHVSSKGRDFVKRLLVVDPDTRLTAQGAISHPWMAQRTELLDSHPSGGLCKALMAFGQASQFRRLAMNMMAWSLTNEEMGLVRQAFLDFDTDKSGCISMKEFHSVLSGNFHMEHKDIDDAFQALDVNHDHFIEYSEFLAAMVSSRIKLHDDLLRQTFRRFDTSNTGFITSKDLKEILGNSLPSEKVDSLVQEVSHTGDDKISYDEFMHYLADGDCKQHHHDAAVRIIDNALQTEEHAHRKTQFVRMHTAKLNGAQFVMPKQAQVRVEHKHQPIPERSRCACVVM